MINIISKFFNLFQLRKTCLFLEKFGNSNQGQKDICRCMKQEDLTKIIVPMLFCRQGRISADTEGFFYHEADSKVNGRYWTTIYRQVGLDLQQVGKIFDQICDSKWPKLDRFSFDTSMPHCDNHNQGINDHTYTISLSFGW